MYVTFNEDVWVIHSSVMDISIKGVAGFTHNSDKGRGEGISLYR